MMATWTLIQYLPVSWEIYINLLIDLRDSAKRALLFPLLHFPEVLFWNKHAFTKSFKDSTKRSHVFFTKFSFQGCILHNYSRTYWYMWLCVYSSMPFDHICRSVTTTTIKMWMYPMSDSNRPPSCCALESQQSPPDTTLTICSPSL